MSNVYEHPTEFKLTVRPGVRRSGSFMGVGRVALVLPPELLSLWKESRYRGSGLRLSHGTVTVDDEKGAVLEGLKLPPRFEAPVTIRFERPRTKFRETRMSWTFCRPPSRMVLRSSLEV